MVNADRFETFAATIASTQLCIPTFHIEGGDTTEGGALDDSVRHAITKLSDIHLVANKDSYNRIKKLGEDPKKIFVTGCPSIDIAKESIKHNLKKIKLDGVGNEIDLSKDYCVVLQHSDTSRFDRSRNDITCILKAIKKINYQTVWFWPNPDAGTSNYPRV